MFYRVLKRLFDITFSLIGLLFLSPVFVYVAFRIKQDTPGPAFYSGTRIGRNGKLFAMVKFRTMFNDAHLMPGGPSSGDDDPRITNYGRRLRNAKLNEIPQLINVLKSDMSFVGPRPEVSQYVEQYTEEEKAILTVKPGITDYASLKFHNEGEILKGQPDPDKAYEELIRPEKLRLQLKYVRTRSFWRDLKILLATLWTLFEARASSES